MFRKHSQENAHLLWGISIHNHPASLHAELGVWESTQVLLPLQLSILGFSRQSSGTEAGHRRKTMVTVQPRSRLLGGNPTLGESWQVKGRETRKRHRGCASPSQYSIPGLINAIADEHSAENTAVRATVVPNSRGSLLRVSLFHSNCTCWGVHTCPGPLCSEARLGMYFLLRQF